MAEITRETLALAVLAAGKCVVMAPIGRYTFDALDVSTLMAWRPHLDDGDAARLAVRLNMTGAHLDKPIPRWAADHDSLNVVHTCTHDGTEPDKLRAWREAVVLCAAAVGERIRGER